MGTAKHDNPNAKTFDCTDTQKMVNLDGSPIYEVPGVLALQASTEMPATELVEILRQLPPDTRIANGIQGNDGNQNVTYFLDSASFPQPNADGEIQKITYQRHESGPMMVSYPQKGD